MSKHTIKITERGERHLESMAEEFGVSKDKILVSKLKMRGVSKEIAADLFLGGEIEESKAREYFDQEEIEKLKKSKERLEKESE